MPTYIDKDTLKKHYVWWDDENKKLFDTIVDLQSAVDIQPAKHGKWIPHLIEGTNTMHGFDCSACGAWIHYELCYTLQETQIYHYKYCPICGARMDENEHTD